MSTQSERGYDSCFTKKQMTPWERQTEEIRQNQVFVHYAAQTAKVNVRHGSPRLREEKHCTREI